MDSALQIWRVRAGTWSVLLLILGVVGNGTIATAQSSGTFTATGGMTTDRSQHTASLLPNGKVLIVGGARWTLPSSPDVNDCYVPDVGCVLASAELFDPAAGTFSRTGDMTTARRLHAATLLADGKILITGGYGIAGDGRAVASAELYDPATGTFTPTGNMINARGGHSAILLLNGQVLIVGGGDGNFPNVSPAELYDPASAKFAAAAAYVGHGSCDYCAPATRLADGTVLFPGQYPAQIYDPVKNVFRVAGMMISDHTTAALLLNGKVLFTGGESDSIDTSNLAELYDPTKGTFASTGNMIAARVWHTLTLLPNGAVLAAGGETAPVLSVASAENYDPWAGTFLSTGQMSTTREGHTATLLKDGRVLVAGGGSSGRGIFLGELASAELYSPSVLIPAAALVSLSGDGQGQGAIFHAGTTDAVTPDDPAAADEDVDIYCTGLAINSRIPPQVAIGGRMAEVLLVSWTPDAPGRTQVTVRVPSGITPGPAVPVRLTYLDRSSNEVTIGVQ